MFHRLTTTQKAMFAAFAGYTGFAFADAFAKWLGGYYSASEVLMWSNLVAMTYGLIFSAKLGGLRRTFQTKKLPYHIGRGICALVIGLLVIKALSQGLPLATMYTVIFLSPFLVTLAAIPIYGERVSARSWGIIACGFLGILVAFHRGLGAFSVEILYIVSALAFIAALALFARPLAKDETLFSLSFYPSLTIVSLLMIYYFPHYNFPAPEHLPYFLINGLCIAVGFTGIAWGYRHGPFAVVSPVHYSQMIFALVLGYFVFGDAPDFWMLAGAGIIMISGVTLVLSKER